MTSTGFVQLPLVKMLDDTSYCISPMRPPRRNCRPRLFQLVVNDEDQSAAVGAESGSVRLFSLRHTHSGIDAVRDRG
jgi:hypothetical protein